MKKIEIETTKTARYFQMGEFTAQTENLIIACHGYGQLANYFLKWFETPSLTNTVIIAPEGLHRFYWEGFNGNVVASWMTKEDRETDIKDYVAFLDNIVTSLHLSNKIRLTALGFSQGAATITRWADQTKHSIENLVLWSGVFPDDISLSSICGKVKNPVQIYFGDDDQFYTKEQIDTLKTKLTALQTNLVFNIFNGKHKIYPEPLNNLYEKLKLN